MRRAEPPKCWSPRAEAGAASTAAGTAADWNVVVTLTEQSFRDAVKLLARWGVVKRTHYYNVVGMKVADIGAFLADFAAALAASPGILNFISHVVPAQRTFDFSTAEEFEARAAGSRWTGRRYSAARAFMCGCIGEGSKAFCRRPMRSGFSTRQYWRHSETPAGSSSPIRMPSFKSRRSTGGQACRFGRATEFGATLS